MTIIRLRRKSIMWSKNILIQIRILFGIILLNFIAQIPYFFHLYYHKFSDLWRLFNIPMLSVLALFLIGYVLLIKHKETGYWLLILFLSMEFLFIFGIQSAQLDMVLDCFFNWVTLILFYEQFSPLGILIYLLLVISFSYYFIKRTF